MNFVKKWDFENVNFWINWGFSFFPIVRLFTFLGEKSAVCFFMYCTVNLSGFFSPMLRVVGVLKCVFMVISSVEWSNFQVFWVCQFKVHVGDSGTRRSVGPQSLLAFWEGRITMVETVPLKLSLKPIFFENAKMQILKVLKLDLIPFFKLFRSKKKKKKKKKIRLYV